MKQYAIQTDLDKTTVKYINADVYRKIYDEFNFLMHYIWFENKYQILLENYYDFESELFISWDKLKEDTETKINEGQEILLTLNRRVLNFTSSAKNYIDDIDYNTSKIFDDGCKDKLKIKKQKIYDENLSYQLMEMFRNVFQHRCSLIRCITIIKSIFNNDLQYIPLLLNIKIKDIVKLEKFEQKIKKKDELKQNIDADLNVIYHLREYMKLISSLHDEIRIEYNQKIINYVNDIKEIIASIRNNNIHFMRELAFIELDPEKEIALNWVLVDENTLDKCKTKALNRINQKKYFISRPTIPYYVKELYHNCSFDDIRFNII